MEYSLKIFVLLQLFPLPQGRVYVGCFDTWLSVPHNTKYENYTATSTIQQCLDKCEINYDENRVTLVRSWFCICTFWNREELGLPRLRRVADSNCDLERNSMCVSAGDSNCGGTFAYSAYSNIRANDSSYFDFEEVYKNDLSFAEYSALGLNPEMKCAKCRVEACVFVPHWILVPGISSTTTTTTVTVDSYKYKENSHLLDKHQYAFRNSPVNCINYCRRYKESTKIGEERESDTVVALGFQYILDPAEYFEYEYPHSFCYCIPTGRITDFTVISPTQCVHPCPGDKTVFCGGGNDNETKYLHYTIYKLPFDAQSKKSDAEDLGTHSARFKTDNGDYCADITLEYLQSATGNSLNLSFHQTINTGNWKHCSAYDVHNQHWEGKPGDIVVKACPSGYPEGENASWECLPSGTFAGSSPIYTNCKNKWVGEAEEKVQEQEQEEADLVDVLLEVEKRTEEAKNPSLVESHYYGHEISIILNITRLGIKNITLSKFAKNITECGIRIVDNILTHPETWKQITLEERIESATDALETIEVILVYKLLIEITNSSDEEYAKQYQYESKVVDVGSGLINKSDVKTVMFPIGCDTIGINNCQVVPHEFINIPVNQDLMFTAMRVKSDVLQDKLPGRINSLEDPNEKNKILIGPLMAFSFFSFSSEDPNAESIKKQSSDGSKLNVAVSISILHEIPTSGRKTSLNVKRSLHPGESPKAALSSVVCVYWNEKGLFWSPDGCWLFDISSTRSICRCSHTTYYSALVSLHNYEANEKGLEVVTIVLTSFSTLALVASCIIYYTNIDPKKHAVITQQLSILLLLGNIAMLMLVDRTYMNLQPGVCTAVAVITEYLYLASFMFMAVEGWIAYKSIIEVKHPDKISTARMSIIAYTFPLVILLATGLASVITEESAFGGERACWLEGDFIWSFLTPVAIILSGNFFVIWKIVRAAQKSQAKMMGQHLQKSRLTLRLRGIMSLSLLFGLSWIPGYLVLIPNSDASIGMAYLFTVLNASQGILVAVFYCFLDTEKMTNFRKQVFPTSWFNWRSSAPFKPVSRGRVKGNGPKANNIRFGSVKRSYSVEKNKMMKSS